MNRQRLQSRSARFPEVSHREVYTPLRWFWMSTRFQLGGLAAERQLALREVQRQKLDRHNPLGQAEPESPVCVRRTGRRASYAMKGVQPRARRIRRADSLTPQITRRPYGRILVLRLRFPFRMNTAIIRVAEPDMLVHILRSHSFPNTLALNNRAKALCTFVPAITRKITPRAR